jgi:hypothetical protein
MCLYACLLHLFERYASMTSSANHHLSLSLGACALQLPTASSTMAVPDLLLAGCVGPDPFLRQAERSAVQPRHEFGTSMQTLKWGAKGYLYTSMFRSCLETCASMCNVLSAHMPGHAKCVRSRAVHLVKGARWCCVRRAHGRHTLFEESMCFETQISRDEPTS